VVTRTEENNAFGLRLLQQLLDSAASVRPSKADLDRFRYTSAGSLQARCYRAIKTLLLAPFREKSSVLRQGREWQAISHSMGAVGGLLNGLVKLYGRLSDRRSRELLIELIAFRILGEERVRLSLNTEDYWAKRASLKSFFDFSDCIPTGDRNETLGRINLSWMGYPITLYSIPIVIHTIFESKQYEYPECKPAIKACKGDVVVDVGG